MSFWGATVIMNIVSVTLASVSLTSFLTGSVLFDYLMTATDLLLPRLFILHFLLSLVLVGALILHLLSLHKVSSVAHRAPILPVIVVAFGVGFTNSFILTLLKDLFIASIGLLLLAVFTLFFVGFFHRHDNSIEANPLITPVHIIPE
jgi:ubiquinol-cytochrome c reductase cytochrome b subunit